MIDEPVQWEYSTVSKAFHWIVVALLTVQFSVAWAMPHVSRTTKPVGLVGWHLSIGTAILACAVARLAWRWRDPAPAAGTEIAPHLRVLARATHILLYVILFVLPVMGWANASYRGWTVRLFGWIQLPALLPVGSPLGHRLGDLHSSLAIGFLAVIFVHVLGALYHGFVLRDGTLQRMLGRASRGR